MFLKKKFKLTPIKNSRGSFTPPFPHRVSSLHQLPWHTFWNILTHCLRPLDTALLVRIVARAKVAVAHRHPHVLTPAAHDAASTKTVGTNPGRVVLAGGAHAASVHTTWNCIVWNSNLRPRFMCTKICNRPCCRGSPILRTANGQLSELQLE